MNTASICTHCRNADQPRHDCPDCLALYVAARNVERVARRNSGLTGARS